MATCAINGNILTPDGEASTSVTVYARILQPQIIGTSVISPFIISTSVDTSGNFTLTVQQSLNVVFTVEYPIVGTEPMRTFSYVATIPAQTSANFTSVITIE